MKNAVLINAYPINEKKQQILERSVKNFKKLGLPIIVVSGCDIPIHISKDIDYYIINREKLVLDKSYLKICNDLLNKNNNLACLAFNMNNLWAWVYYSNHNVTIARNTKMVFEFAKSIGFENVFYTEDDNVFNEDSFESIRNHLEILNQNSGVKFISSWGTMVDSNTPMLFSCLFFANINFFLEHFKIPTSVEEWYNPENIIKYKLHRAYEESLHECFFPVKDQTYNYISEYVRLIESKSAELNLTSRYEELNWRVNTTFTVLKELNGTRLFFVAYNFVVSTSNNKEIHLKVIKDENIIFDNLLQPQSWYYEEVTNANKISFYVNGNLIKDIDVTDIKSIENNGNIIIS